MVINFGFERSTPIAGVYCIHNLENNKRYVGSSVNVLVRLEKHRALLRKGVHQNPYLQNSWNKYGEESFICYLLEAYDTEVTMHLAKREQKWVDLLGSEYNLTKEVIRNNLSKESRKKQSDTRKRLFAEGKLIPTKMHPVKQFDLDGNFLKEYPSITQAAKTNNLHATTIIRCVKKQTSQGRGYIWRYSNDTSPIHPVNNCKRTKYIDLIKSDEFRGTPEMDNPEPSL